MSDAQPKAQGQDTVPIHALAAVIRAADGDARLDADPDAWLRELGVNAKDREQMLRMGAKRLRAYRSLVTNRLRNVIFAFLPRTKALVGAESLRAEGLAFLEQQGMGSPYLRDIPGEFVRWATPRWANDPRFGPGVAQLAAYELLKEELPNDGNSVGEPTDAPVALDLRVRVNGTAAVHRFDFDVLDRQCERPPTAQLLLLACRDRKHAYRELRVDPLGAALFAALQEGQSLAQSIFAAAGAIDEAVQDPLLERATLALAQMIDIDALLGAHS